MCWWCKVSVKPSYLLLHRPSTAKRIHPPLPLPAAALICPEVVLPARIESPAQCVTGQSVDDAKGHLPRCSMSPAQNPHGESSPPPHTSKVTSGKLRFQVPDLTSSDRLQVLTFATATATTDRNGHTWSLPTALRLGHHVPGVEPDASFVHSCITLRLTSVQL